MYVANQNQLLKTENAENDCPRLRCRNMRRRKDEIAFAIYKFAFPIPMLRKSAPIPSKKAPTYLTTAIQMWYLCCVRFMNQQTQLITH